MSFDFINKPVRYTKREYGLVMKTGKLKCYVSTAISLCTTTIFKDALVLGKTMAARTAMQVHNVMICLHKKFGYAFLFFL